MYKNIYTLKLKLKIKYIIKKTKKYKAITNEISVIVLF